MDIKLVNDTISTIMEYLHGEIGASRATAYLRLLKVPEEVIEHITDTMFNYTLENGYDLFGIIPTLEELA